MVTVDATQATDNDYITLKDVDSINSRVNGVDRCSPMLMGFGKATIDSQAKEATAMLVGVNSDTQYAFDRRLHLRSVLYRLRSTAPIRLLP